MARPVRIEYEGAVYPVTLRGSDRRALFSTDADRERFVGSLAESVHFYLLDRQQSIREQAAETIKFAA